MNQTLQKICTKSLTELKRHSPLILTCLGAVGLVATTITAVRATPRAVRLIQRAEDKKGDALTKPEIVKVAAPIYIPSAIIGVSTLACIFGANVLNERRQAALASTCIFLEQSYKKYRSAVNEVFGENADAMVRKAMVAKSCVDKTESLKRSGEYIMFYEEYYGDFFERTMAEVLDAESKMNRKLAMDGYASVNDFLELLGLYSVEYGDQIGWDNAWLDFEHETVELEDGMECTIIHIPTTPSLE